MRYLQFKQEKFQAYHNPNLEPITKANLFVLTMLLGQLNKEVSELAVVNPVITAAFIKALERARDLSPYTVIIYQPVKYVSDQIKNLAHYRNLVVSVKKLLILPAVRIYQHPDKNLIGLIFYHQIIRDCFVAYLDRLQSSFSLKEQTLAESKFPGLFSGKIRDTRWLVMDEKNKHSLFIRAYHQQNYLTNNYMFAVCRKAEDLQNFCNLLSLPEKDISKDKTSIRFLSSQLKPGNELTATLTNPIMSCLLTCYVFVPLLVNTNFEVGVIGLIAGYYHDCITYKKESKELEQKEFNHHKYNSFYPLPKVEDAQEDCVPAACCR